MSQALRKSAIARATPTKSSFEIFIHRVERRLITPNHINPGMKQVKQMDVVKEFSANPFLLCGQEEFDLIWQERKHIPQEWQDGLAICFLQPFKQNAENGFVFHCIRFMSQIQADILQGDWGQFIVTGGKMWYEPFHILLLSPMSMRKPVASDQMLHI